MAPWVSGYGMEKDLQGICNPNRNMNDFMTDWVLKSHLGSNLSKTVL